MRCASRTPPSPRSSLGMANYPPPSPLLRFENAATGWHPGGALTAARAWSLFAKGDNLRRPVSKAGDNNPTVILGRPCAGATPRWRYGFSGRWAQIPKAREQVAYPLARSAFRTTRKFRAACESSSAAFVAELVFQKVRVLVH